MEPVIFFSFGPSFSYATKTQINKQDLPTIDFYASFCVLLCLLFMFQLSPAIPTFTLASFIFAFIFFHFLWFAIKIRHPFVKFHELFVLR